MPYSRLINFIVAGLLVFPAIMSGCSMPDKHDKYAEDGDTNEVADITQDAATYADSVLQSLDTIAKIGQLIMPAVMTDSSPYAIARIKEYAEMGIGGIILLKGDIKSATTIVDTLVRCSKIPPFIAIDAEWGLGMRLHDAPKFPINADIDSLVDEQTMFDYGREVADESRKLGINMILGPVLDVSSRDEFIGRRSFGTDPERVSDLAVAYACGVESGNVISVAKHFPGHGAAPGDSHKNMPVISKSLQSLDSIDLKPFKTYINNGLSGIMTGHLAFPAIDPKGMPAALSKPVITDLLRNDLGFKGLVLTDALNMQGALGLGAEQAIMAGTDIILAPKDTRAEINSILNSLKSGEISESELNGHVRRILTYKYLLNTGKHAEILSADSIITPNTRRIQHELRSDRNKAKQ